MKKIVLSCLLILFSTVAMASEYDIFFGVGYGQLKRTYDVNDIQVEDESYQDKVLIKAGAKDIDTRIYTSFSYFEKGNNEKQYSWMLNFEALSDDYFFYDVGFNMFWGAQAGALKVDFQDKTSDKTYASTGIAYGLQGGLLFDITKNIALELNYETLWSPLNIEDMNLNGTKYNYSFDYNQNFYIGLNYSF